MAWGDIGPRLTRLVSGSMGSVGRCRHDLDVLDRQKLAGTLSIGGMRIKPEHPNRPEAIPQLEPPVAVPDSIFTQERCGDGEVYSVLWPAAMSINQFCMWSEPHAIHIGAGLLQRRPCDVVQYLN